MSPFLIASCLLLKPHSYDFGQHYIIAAALVRSTVTSSLLNLMVSMCLTLFWPVNRFSFLLILRPLLFILFCWFFLFPPKCLNLYYTTEIPLLFLYIQNLPDLIVIYGLNSIHISTSTLGPQTHLTYSIIYLFNFFVIFKSHVPMGIRILWGTYVLHPSLSHTVHKLLRRSWHFSVRSHGVS